MKVHYSNNFYDQIDKISDTSIVRRAQQAVEKFRTANSLHEITNIKAMDGWPTFYRLRFGDFRIGFQLTDNNEIKLLAIDHRSKIYRHFPKNFA